MTADTSRRLPIPERDLKFGKEPGPPKREVKRPNGQAVLERMKREQPVQEGLKR